MNVTITAELFVEIYNYFEDKRGIDKLQLSRRFTGISMITVKSLSEILCVNLWIPKKISYIRS